MCKSCKSWHSFLRYTDAIRVANGWFRLISKPEDELRCKVQSAMELCWWIVWLFDCLCLLRSGGSFPAVVSQNVQSEYSTADFPGLWQCSCASSSSESRRLLSAQSTRRAVKVQFLGHWWREDPRSLRSQSFFYIFSSWPKPMHRGQSKKALRLAIGYDCLVFLIYSWLV